MARAATDAGFPVSHLGTYIQPVQQGRACHLEFNLAFDPGSAVEVEQARQLYLQASQDLAREGAFFSRPYGAWAELVNNQYGPNMLALRKVKEIFDPGRVLNPGRLGY